ncbi:MAG: inositol monophosphatase [Anaerolineales bacterium]|nr:inositol monophosphatase [Anaerolineales bacterium]
MNWEHTLQVAIDIARETGALLRRGYGEPKEIARKSTAVDWVTQYDTAAEALILQRLQAAFPTHHVITEESGLQANARAHDSPYTWQIDPLDGTTNFAHGFPVFCVSLALVEADQPRLGVVYDPLRDECFSGADGRGATLQRGDLVQPLRVSQTETLLDALLATGFPYDRHTSEANNVAQTAAFLRRAQGIRRAGAAALDLAYVAAGRLDGYWEYKLHSWDVAAGILLVREAGGTVTMMDGSPLTLTPRPELVASNGRLHQPMLDVLAAVNISGSPTNTA